MYKILHIEQSDFFSKILKRILIEKGYTYIQTDNFFDAYELLNDNDVDLVITSLIGREGNIEDFLNSVNESPKKGIPIFVVSSNNVNDQRKELFDLGITDYILKETIESNILKHISSVLKEDEDMNKLKELSVAIVDDSDFEKTIEKGILENNDIKNVDSYSSGKELFNSKKKYDVYLIDIVLKNEFGRNLISYIRELNPESVIIAVTSLTNSKTLSSILDFGADDIISKPIDEELFISKLKSNIRR